MSPFVKRLLFTAAAAAIVAVATLPEVAAYAPMLTALAGFLGGAAHVSKPGDVKATSGA